MNCTEFRTALGSVEHARLRACPPEWCGHLAECPDCQQVWDDHVRLMQAIDVWRAVPLTDWKRPADWLERLATEADWVASPAAAAGHPTRLIDQTLIATTQSADQHIESALLQETHGSKRTSRRWASAAIASATAAAVLVVVGVWQPSAPPGDRSIVSRTVSPKPTADPQSTHVASGLNSAAAPPSPSSLPAVVAPQIAVSTAVSGLWTHWPRSAGEISTLVSGTDAGAASRPSNTGSDPAHAAEENAPHRHPPSEGQSNGVTGSVVARWIPSGTFSPATGTEGLFLIGANSAVAGDSSSTSAASPANVPASASASPQTAVSAGWTALGRPLQQNVSTAFQFLQVTLPTSLPGRRG
jgi:hypothetical protein